MKSAPKGWQTRIVDHATESGLNWAVQPQDRPDHDTLDCLAAMSAAVATKRRHLRFWKRDISRAFRRHPIFFLHLHLTWVIWSVDGRRWKAQQRGTGFGPTLAVYSWHRYGSFVRTVARVLGHCIAARYVDDFYGIDVAYVHLTGGAFFEVLSALIGIPYDPDKSSDEAISMVILGILLEYVPRDRTVRGTIESLKAAKWSAQLLEFEITGICAPGDAAKTAGRLAHTVCQAADRVGRAWIWPFYAQQHSPMKGNRISDAFKRACRWFRAYLLIGHRLSVRAQPQCVRTWSHGKMRQGRPEMSRRSFKPAASSSTPCGIRHNPCGASSCRVMMSKFSSKSLPA